MAKDFFCHHLPMEILAEIDLSTLIIVKNDYLDVKCREYVSDMVYRVSMRSEKYKYFYLLLEHQSTPDYKMLLRILNYSLRILEQHIRNNKAKNKKNIKLPIICPLVVYHGRQKPYPYSNNLFDMFMDSKLAQKCMFTKFQLVDLTIMKDSDIHTHGRAALIEVVQKYVLQQDSKIVLEKLQKNIQKLFDIIGFDKFKDIWPQVVNYIFWSRQEADEKAIMGMLQRLNIKGVDMRTIAEALLDRGWHKGIVQGRQEGRKEGRQEGRQAYMQVIIKKMLQQGISVERISKITELTAAEVLAIKLRS